jgi:hypothetical protein
MTDHADLERGYRRLLGSYPRAFRREKGPEILAVLMAGAPDGQRRPGPAESADLIRGGLWMRLHASVPRSARTVRAAVRLIYAGAAVSVVQLIIALAFAAGDLNAYHVAMSGHHLTAAQLSHLRPFLITLVIGVPGLLAIAVWLWMARAVGQGRNWARIASTVLFGLATLEWAGHNGDVAQLLLFTPALGFGGAAVWQLWRPASTAFFHPRGFPDPEQAGIPAMSAIGPGGQLAGMPQPLVDGVSPTIGWQFRPRAKGGPAFVIIRRRGLGWLRAVETFPATEQGWASAWQSLIKQDPGAAAQVLAALKAREVELARLRAGWRGLLPE